MKVLLVFGTRPEAIKMCPLILELKKHNEIETRVCLTGQHREMLNQVMEAFNVVPDYNLDIMKDSQSLTSITASILLEFEDILLQEKPDIVLVHGDTTTSFAVALASFYQKIPVGHVEAGLRTYNKYSPFPEEINRTMTGKLATIHFAPTELNKSNLFKENINENVYVTGNTVIDSFQYTVSDDYVFENSILNDINFDIKKVILITAHRRENLGEPLKQICNAIISIANNHKDILFVYPVHLNPAVRKIVFSKLQSIDNVLLIDPINVFDMHNLISKCYLVMTDSGGLQEEAPSLGKPVLVLRTETERPEAVRAGTVRVVGVNTQSIIDEAERLVTQNNYYNKMSTATNPYGDGHASEKIVDILKNYFIAD